LGLKKTLLAVVSQESNWSRKMGKQTIGQKFREFCLLIAFSIPLSGIAVLAYQNYFWLKQGYWKPLGSRLVLEKVLPTNFSQWLHNPHSWSGLNKIISPVFNSSLAMFLLVFGLVVILLVAKAFDLFSKYEKMEIEVVRTRNWRRT
jgi:hypothetical protein